MTFAHLLLNFQTILPTQAWFDEGFAQYFSSLRLSDNQAQVGGDPTQSLPGTMPYPARRMRTRPNRFTELLGRPWLPMPELFTMRPGPTGYPPMFYAQSWIVMHYRSTRTSYPTAGAYFGLVTDTESPGRAGHPAGVWHERYAI